MVYINKRKQHWAYNTQASKLNITSKYLYLVFIRTNVYIYENSFYFSFQRVCICCFPPVVLISYFCHGVTLGDKAIRLPQGSPSWGWVRKHYLFMPRTVIPLFSHDIASEKCLHLLWNFKHRIPLSGMRMGLCSCTPLMCRCQLCSGVYHWQWQRHTLVSSPGSLVQISLNDDTHLLPHPLSVCHQIKEPGLGIQV